MEELLRRIRGGALEELLRRIRGGALEELLRGGEVKEICELKGRGRSARAIARELGLARNTVLRYLKPPEAIRPQPRPPQGSKLDPYTEYLEHRMSEGLENCRVLLREIRGLGYEGSYTTVADYARPRRRARQPQATMRFETAPGEQAQVDWGSFSYIGENGRKHRVWAFVMVLGWSRAIYVEFVRRADTARASSSATSTPSTIWAECPAAACMTTPRW